MPDSDEISTFITSSFPSVWTLELLCLLRSEPSRSWDHGAMVDALRGSDLVVQRSVQALVAAGLAVLESDARARYQPISASVDALAAAAQALYAERPNAVRRMIVAPQSPGITRFADAFRIWSDK